MVEREWREASDMRRSTLTLVAILTVAAVLRFWALGAGIPNTLGVDGTANHAPVGPDDEGRDTQS